jgi:autotransporter-associated beta strand protein
MPSTPSFPRRPLLLALLAAFALTACGGSDDSDDTLTIPAAPTGLGSVDSAPVADTATVLPFVDNVYTNQRGDARYATLATNAGVRVVSGFLDIWQPSTLLVDAGVTAAAVDGFAAITPSSWTGIPGDASDGTVVNATVHAANIQYVVSATTNRTAAQELAAYLDDRRGKAYSISDGMGPLTSAWRTASEQTTTITEIAADATTVKYDDKGIENGVGSSANTHSFGTVVDLIDNIGENGSTEPAKRFYKYARPWRWSSSVKVVPALEPAKSTTPATDGGFVSGHTAEAVRKGLAMAYAVPERYQEMITRSLVLGENRILAGMHSPLDVIGGRIQGLAVAAASLSTGANKDRRAAAHAQARATLMAAVGATDAAALQTYAHSLPLAEDPYADHATNKATNQRLLTLGFSQIGSTSQAAVVPKGAEVLLETRLPYLSDAQRRVVLKSTALASGYPVMDDAEGWGRLNLFAAADGYGSFNGDVSVSMDASLGGFHALDNWRNDISGAGMLSKLGSGTLVLSGSNSYSGGTQITAGALRADSVRALGNGAVYLSGGQLISNAFAPLSLAGAYTQLADTTLTMNLGSAGAGRLSVGGTVTLAGGSLNIKFQSGYVPTIGDSLGVISATALRGKFTTITVEGYKVTPTYTSTGLQLRIDA